MPDPSQPRHISQADLNRIRQVVESWLRENISGTATFMQVLLCSYHAVRTAIQGGPDAPPLPPDDRDIYTVFIEGDLCIRSHPERKGSMTVLHILPSFETQGVRLLPEGAFSKADMNRLGKVHPLM